MPDVKKAMESVSDITELSNRVLRLEEVIRVQNAMIEDLVERIGDTFARQAFSVKDLENRWNCSESCVRRIISSHKLKLLKGPNGKPRNPIAVLRGSVLEYENGNTMLPVSRRKTKPVPTWAEQPYLPKPEYKVPSGSGVRKLGESLCELSQAKSHALKKA